MGSTVKEGGSLSNEVHTTQFEIPEGSAVIGLYAIMNKIPTTGFTEIKLIEADEPTLTQRCHTCPTMNGSYCYAGDEDGNVRVNGEIVATGNEVCQMLAGIDQSTETYFNRGAVGYSGESINAALNIGWHYAPETVFAWHVRAILYGIPPEEEQDPTPTPGGGYCSVVEPYNDEQENDLGISLPAPIISSARCVELGGWEINTSWIGQGMPETITLPGIRVCLRGISFGTINILGTIIDLDYLAYVIAAIAVIMRMIPR